MTANNCLNLSDLTAESTNMHLLPIFQPTFQGPTWSSSQERLPFYRAPSESESESHSVLSNSLRPMDYTVHGILQARILEWVTFPFSRGSSQPRFPTLQVDSLPAETQGKPENTGVGSLSFLQEIFPTQESNRGLLHCRQILYQLSYPGSPYLHSEHVTISPSLPLNWFSEDQIKGCLWNGFASCKI